MAFDSDTEDDDDDGDDDDTSDDDGDASSSDLSRDKLIFLPLSRGFYAIFPFFFPRPTIFPSCVP